MRTSEQINELATALAKAQGQMTAAVKDTANTFFKSKYATLASCWDACRKPLSDNGLAVVQVPTSEGSTVKITTRLMHASGQWIEDELTLTSKDQTPQGILSCITYGRRGSLSAIVGIAPDDDDDGNQASGRATDKRPEPAKQEPPKSDPPKQPEPCKDYDHLANVLRNLGAKNADQANALLAVACPDQGYTVAALKTQADICRQIVEAINAAIVSGDMTADKFREMAGITLDKPEAAA